MITGAASLKLLLDIRINILVRRSQGLGFPASATLTFFISSPPFLVKENVFFQQLMTVFLFPNVNKKDLGVKREVITVLPLW